MSRNEASILNTSQKTKQNEISTIERFVTCERRKGKR
jgi:hypothetical protein